MYESCYVPTLFRKDWTGCGWMVEGDRAVSLLWMSLPHTPHSSCFKHPLFFSNLGLDCHPPNAHTQLYWKHQGTTSVCTSKPVFHHLCCLSSPALPQGQPKYSDFACFIVRLVIWPVFLDFIKSLSLGAFLPKSTHIFLSFSLRTMRHDFHSVLPVSLLSFHPMPRDVAFTLSARCPWKCQLTTA